MSAKFIAGSNNVIVHHEISIGKLPDEWLIVIGEDATWLFVERLTDAQRESYGKRLVALGLRYCMTNVTAARQADQLTLEQLISDYEKEAR